MPTIRPMSHAVDGGPPVAAPRRATRRLCAVLGVLALLFGLGPAAAQESIDDARSQRDAARMAELQARTALDVLDAEYADVLAAFEAADELVRLAEERADGVRTQLELAEVRLRRTEVGIAWATYDRTQIDEDLTDLAIRRYLGVSDEGEGLLESSDLNETLRRNIVLEVVQGRGYDVIDTARSAADRFEELNDQAEADLAEVQRLQAELDRQLGELETARAVRERARDLLDGRRQEWIDRIDELEAEEQRLTDFIRVEQQRIDIQAALDAVRSSEGYVWPASGPLNSLFGLRVHPVLGYSRLHGGIDIGGRMGQPIWAAKEGIVIMARPNGGYGNTIVIDHGNGFATLYAHQSTFEVREGDYVETGQHIGNVGSTGLSTGPHLHFEIRIDGGVVDPLPYLPAR